MNRRRPGTFSIALLAVLVGVVATSLTACSATDATSVATSPEVACGSTFDELVSAAEAEGELTLIAVPDTWAGYGRLRSTFEGQYDVSTSVIDPEMKSSEELELLRTADGAALPDVIDIGAPYVDQAREEGLVAPFRSRTWDEVPESLKDPDGYWTSAYYGLMAVGATGDMVADLPTSWRDLESDRYRGGVTINGDPNESSSALAAVFAAALASGGSLDNVSPGIDFFSRLSREGILVGHDNTEELLIGGELPIAIDWTYAFKTAASEGLDVEYAVPQDGVYGSFYAQAVVAEAAHPCAARLWMDFLTSDPAQEILLAAGAIPSRIAELEAEGLVDAQTLAMLPQGLDSITFASDAQLQKARELVAQRWASEVLD